ncbi:MAG: Ubiquinone/menaquinone biosynthesis C-methyltransferase UbiE [Planctomycetes bacterium]|nr:Ubiquinone/menaquinone biosynthesis C-methyltransferase UbiE [Planctomycetota bacterium]
MSGAPDPWSAEAALSRFSHAVPMEAWSRLVARDARVLDVGCGWGRTLADLRAAGWPRLAGVDPAPGMIARGRAEHPDLDLRLADGERLPFDDASFDAALLVAVLTAIPDDAAQRAVAAEIRRVLAPGGVLFVSDLLLNDDARNLARYRAAADERLGPWGVFRVDPGGDLVCRHHDPAWLDDLFAGFDVAAREPFTAATMRGHTSDALRLWLRRR